MRKYHVQINFDKKSKMKSKLGRRQQNNERQQNEVEGMSEQQRQRLKEQKRQRKRQKHIEHKQKYLPLMKFLKKQGLRFKTASVQNITVEYFRMDHFEALLQFKKKDIQADKKIKKLLENWEKIFIYYQRLPNQPHFRYPQALQESENGKDSKFASFKFNSAESSTTSTVVILLAVIAIVLFPLWPYELKYFLFRACLYLLITIFVITVVRIVLHLFAALFGINFWLLPNFFKSDTTWDSLIPVFSVKKMKGSTETILIRFILIALFFYYSYHLIQDPSILTDNLEITKTLLEDIDEWGIAKIKGQKNFSQSALTNYSQLFNSTSEQTVF